MSSMNAREIQAAFEKNRVYRKAEGNEIATMLAEAIPEYLEKNPEWFGKRFNAASVCELQSALFVRCRDDRSFLEVIYRNSPKLQELFAQNMRRSPIAGASIVAAAIDKIDQIVRGRIIPTLDQAVCALREIDADAERSMFCERRASPRVVQWLDKGELTFKNVIERSPHLLVVNWHGQ